MLASRRIEIFEDLARQVIDAVRFRRGPELARCAQEQLGSKLAFEQTDPLAHGRLTNPEFLGSSREAASLQGADEGAKTIDAVHNSFHLGINHILSIP